MDRSFLSQTPVVEASRKLVCVRLATYENAREATMLAGLFRTGSGQLENTVFTILAPDGVTPLVRSGRSPWQFRDAEDLAETMESLAASYKPRQATPELPLTASLRLGLDVAACDHIPLVAVFADSPARRQQLASQLAPVAWSPNRIGQAIYCQATPQELAAFRPASSEGYLVLGPDEFGQTGAVLGCFPTLPDERQLTGALARYQPGRMTAHDHMREGHRQRIRWQTQVPVTDPHGKY